MSLATAPAEDQAAAENAAQAAAQAAADELLQQEEVTATRAAAKKAKKARQKAKKGALRPACAASSHTADPTEGSASSDMSITSLQNNSPGAIALGLPKSEGTLHMLTPHKTTEARPQHNSPGAITLGVTKPEGPLHTLNPPKTSGARPRHNSPRANALGLTKSDDAIHTLTPQKICEPRPKSMQLLQASADEVKPTGIDQSSDDLLNANSQLPANETLEDVLQKLLLCPITKVWNRLYILDS